jgi:3-oxoacyl-[acyl-carrier-protein] synthase III
MSIGFEHMVFELPDHRVDVATLVREAGHGEDMVSRLHSGGLRSVPIQLGGNLTYLVRRAVTSLAFKVRDFPTRTGAIVFAHSVPILAPMHTPFLETCVIDHPLDLVPRVAIGGQPCAVLHFAVSVAEAWLHNLPEDKGVLLIGADKGYAATDRVFFGTAMGDAAVAGFLTRTSRQHFVLASVSDCEIVACYGEDSAPEQITRFRQLNPLYIRAAIEACIARGGIRLQELAFIVPHTPYIMIWDAVAELMRFPRNRILTDYIGETGHFNSNDSFAHYIRACEEGRICEGDKVLLVNPGFGGTRGSTLLQR